MNAISQLRDVPAVPQSASRPAVRKFAQSGRMVDCLRHDLLYSEKRPRDFIFAATEELLRERRDAPLILSRLTRDVTTRARELGTAAGLRFANWETTGKAVVRAMLAAGALLTPQGEMVPAGVEALATQVASVREGYRDLTESFLVEFLISRLGDVTLRDHTALAHALFRQFDPNISMEDQEDRVAILLAMRSEQIELRGQTYTLRGESRV